MCVSSDIIGPYDSFDLYATDWALCNRLIRRFVQNSPSGAGLAHDAMAAVEEHSVDLASKTDVTVVEGLLLLLQ